MNANGHLLESLSRSEMFQDYERAYEAFVGKTKPVFKGN